MTVHILHIFCQHLVLLLFSHLTLVYSHVFYGFYIQVPETDLVLFFRILYFRFDSRELHMLLNNLFLLRVSLHIFFIAVSSISLRIICMNCSQVGGCFDPSKLTALAEIPAPKKVLLFFSQFFLQYLQANSLHFLHIIYKASSNTFHDTFIVFNLCKMCPYYSICTIQLEYRFMC